MNSISDVYGYKHICRLASENDEYFNKFKSDSAYNGILEHVSKEQGEQYLNILRTNHLEFLEKINSFKKNDLYGGTKLSYYDGIGNISPTTLRYIKVLYDLKTIFGDLNNKKIVEIGVGYGGQCFIVNQEFTISNYTLIDLDEVLSLSSKYLSKLNVNHSVIKIDEINNIDYEFDLVISNYAYSELNKELQDLYWEKIIKKSKHGYFTLNFISDLFNIDSYNKEELLEKFSIKNHSIFDEKPKTFDNNLIVYF